MQRVLEQSKITSESLEIVLAKRQRGQLSFLLVDVREEHEYSAGHIAGVDLLCPFSTMRSWEKQFVRENRTATLVLTCRTGNRSGQVQRLLLQAGCTRVLNHTGGILSYGGRVIRY
jgi:rhodanese-related sulfurtransferase